MKLAEKISVARNGVSLETSIRIKERGKAAGQAFIGLVLPSVESMELLDKTGPLTMADGKVVSPLERKWSLLQDWLTFLSPEVVTHILDNSFGSGTMQSLFESAFPAEGQPGALVYKQVRFDKDGKITTDVNGKLGWEIKGNFDQDKFIKAVAEYSVKAESKAKRREYVKGRISELHAIMAKGDTSVIQEILGLSLELSQL